jgi:hypothetical protein
MEEHILRAREVFLELLAPSRLYLDPSELEFDQDFDPDEFEYLTPEMVKMFRHSEVRSLQDTFQEPQLETKLIDRDFKTDQLVKILNKRFEKGLERNPVLWPVLPMKGL